MLPQKQGLSNLLLSPPQAPREGLPLKFPHQREESSCKRNVILLSPLPRNLIKEQERLATGKETQSPQPRQTLICSSEGISERSPKDFISVRS